MQTLNFDFGPLRYELHTAAAVGATLAPFVSQSHGGRTYTAHVAAEIASTEVDRVVVANTRESELHGPGFVARLTPPMEATVRLGNDDGAASLSSLLSAVVARDAVRNDLIVLHGAGLACEQGTVLVIGSSGVGKSTLARRAGARAFCYNAALVDPTRLQCWPLPFTGHDDPPVCDVGSRPIAACVVLERQDPARAERLTGSAATNAVLRHIVVHEGDPAAIEGVSLAIRFSVRVPVFRLVCPHAEDPQLGIDSLLLTGTLPS